MEPLGTLHDSIEVEIFGRSLGDGRVGTVVDNLRGTHACTCFSIVKTHAVATTGNKLGVHAISAKGIHGNLADFMLWQLAHEICLVTIVSH